MNGAWEIESVDLLDRLLGHDAWTTQEILNRCSGLSDQELNQDFDIGHRTVYETLVHMISNVSTWTDLMEGNSVVPGRETWEGLPMATLIEWHERAYGNFAQIACRIRDDGRWDELWLDVLDKPPAFKSFGGAITHVITHDMHHRSELLHMLARLGLDGLPEGDALTWEQTTATSRS
jgi:uncharacterized damage-inducible protein DinB